MTKSTGAARQARQRSKGVQVAVILPPPAAEALAEIRRQRECTQAQAISMALHLMLERLQATPAPSPRAAPPPARGSSP